MTAPSPPPDAAPAIAAATLVILRAGTAETEVLMLRRHHALSAFGGLWVFPGGKIEVADRHYGAWLDAKAERAPVPDLFANVPGGAPQMGSSASRIAAIRETFEETGLLYATAMDEGFGYRYQRHGADWRVAVARDAATFESLLSAEHVEPDLPALHYWLRMVPPQDVPRRFDTDFFLALAPASQEPRVDLTESMDVRWIPLSDVDHPELECAPVTRIALLELRLRLQQHGTLTQYLTEARTRPCRLLYTRRGLIDGVATVVFPWDPGYLEVAGDGEAWSAEECAHMQGVPGRLPIQDGLFRTAESTDA